MSANVKCMRYLLIHYLSYTLLFPTIFGSLHPLWGFHMCMDLFSAPCAWDLCRVLFPGVLPLFEKPI